MVRDEKSSECYEQIMVAMREEIYYSKSKAQHTNGECLGKRSHK